MTGPSATAPEPVDVTRLRLGEEIARGGQGTVTRVENAWINGSWPAVIKEYKEEYRADLDAEALHLMVSFAHEQRPADSRWLFEHTAWPAAVVEREGQTIGFLMREIPERFFIDLGTGDRKVSGTEYLLNSDTYLRNVGLYISSAERMGVLYATACKLARLHGMGVAVGDLSPKNLLFSLRPEPGAFLLDCDAMRVRNRTILPQAETPDWQLPSGEELGTQAGDAFKFGLLAIRVAGSNQDLRDPASLSSHPELQQLAVRCLTNPPHTRPAISEWIGPLSQAEEVSRQRPAPSATASGWGTPAPPPYRPRPAFSTPVGPTAPPHRPARSKAVVGLLVAVVVVYLLYQFAAHMSGSPERAQVGAVPGAGADDTGSGQATAVQELLERNDGTRVAVSEAVGDVQRCDASEAVSTFSSAAQQRDDLLDSLAELRVDALPGGEKAVGSLRSGWKHSAAADRAYQRWAESMSVDCRRNAAQSDWRAAADEATRPPRRRSGS